MCVQRVICFWQEVNFNVFSSNISIYFLLSIIFMLHWYGSVQLPFYFSLILQAHLCFDAIFVWAKNNQVHWKYIAVRFIPIHKRAFNNLMLKLIHWHNSWMFFTASLVSPFYFVHQKGTAGLKPLHLELKYSKFHKTQVSLNIFLKVEKITVSIT
jgi:hypothetical protein